MDRTFDFMTNRGLQNKDGKETGRVKAAVRVGSGVLEGQLTCPECLKTMAIKQPFKRPILIKCPGCAATIRLAKMKDELKKEKKKARAS